PWNPNGSIHNIAGICNGMGNVLGLMPHPERAFYKYQHPEYSINGGKNYGKNLFRGIINYLEKNF
ncbi:MAG: phosphoribosylformylglycinamidine synthase subunit PurQ, partial [Nanopusillaceae archaeon]